MSFVVELFSATNNCPVPIQYNSIQSSKTAFTTGHALTVHYHFDTGCETLSATDLRVWAKHDKDQLQLQLLPAIVTLIR